MKFAPIAIVGRACVLPGALSPAALWTAIRDGRDLTGRAPPGRWRLSVDAALRAAGDTDPDRAFNDRGAYVQGFEAIWNADGFAVPAEQLAGLDPLVHWLLHCAREALVGVTHSPARSGAIFGNLGFPSEAMARYAEQVWCGQSGVDARNRFMSGGSAAILRDALALGCDSLSLDAACASSLYALSYACKQLQTGRADLMLAGAVQRADDLFLHVGFSALQALSRSGQSRPFHRDADGLLPAEGAVMFALKRLADARRDGDVIHGVIRGIGLSNDGRGRGLLVPDQLGQQRALQAAYHSAGLSPAAIGLLECHATGTVVGDATELTSSAQVFADAKDLPIGSLKSNLGHAITVAGGAALLKVLAAMQAGVRPPSLHADVPNPALAATPFRLLRAAEAWPASSGPRIAAVSAFGFGGNNAHLIVSEDHADIDTNPSPPEQPSLAVIGLAIRSGGLDDQGALARYLAVPRGSRPAVSPVIDEITLDLDGLRLPPRDLERILPQQLQLLALARQLHEPLARLPGNRTAVLIGMEPDAEVARYGLRWRLGDAGFDAATLARRRDAVVPALDAAAVLGTMPNIPANRLNSQFDFGGPSCTVQAGDASGLAALALACQQLFDGEIDAALVGAVDFCCEPVQAQADPRRGADAAVLLLLRRLADARADGARVFAVIEPGATDSAPMPTTLVDELGSAATANGLRDLVAELIRRQNELDADGLPTVQVDDASLSLTLPGQLKLRFHPAAWPERRVEVDLPRLYCYAGANREAVIENLLARKETLAGPARLVIVATTAECETQHERALRHLREGVPAGPAIHFRAAPVSGELAFVFAGAGASYPDMGRSLLLDLPMLKADLGRTAPKLLKALRLAWLEDFENADPSAQLCAASALSQCHLALSEQWLGLKADAWLGYSSGETNALFASGVWSDPDALMQAMDESALMTRELSGEFAAIKRQWGEHTRFATWTVVAPLSEVSAALADAPRARLAIIDSDEQCLIAGDAEHCQRVVERIGRARCLPLSYSLAVHMPEVAAVAEAWRQLHWRPTQAARHGRIYSSAHGEPYQPSADACAQAILDQAIDTLDMRKVIERAYADGVRIFIEHGPGGSFARALRSVLGEREALIVSLDRKGQGIDGVMQVAAALIAAGVPVDLQALQDVCRMPESPMPIRRPLSLPGHWPPVANPMLNPMLNARQTQSASSMPNAVQRMAMPPSLPAVDFRPKPRARVTSVAESAPVAGKVMPPGNPMQSVQAQKPARAVAESARLASAALLTPHHAAVAAPSPDRALLAGLQAQLQSLAHMQQQFIAAQTDAQQRFMAWRQQSVETLLRAAHAGHDGTGSRVLPAPPVMPELPSVVHLPAPVQADRHPTAALIARTNGQEESKVSAPTQSVPPAPSMLAPPSGPSFDRAQLEIHADGAISSLFGPAFAEQDGFHRQVRMPKPPLLLADRVIGLDAEPNSMGKGRIWTETDVAADAWYLHQNHMPAGVMIEAGQADLMLISYLGIDRFNRSERVYRLLGCELTYHGDLPRSGETLRFEITLDGHAAQGDVRLMFFHYDCVNGDRRQLSVRQGQAGFFTDAELADSAGCIWSPETQSIRADARVDPPAFGHTRSSYERKQLEAFAAGDLVRCFGASHGFARTHTRTPTIAGGRMLLFDRITEVSTEGGPWQRGYLRAELDIDPTQWFFDGHFKNDPCMPGTLMFEACLQAMAFYQAACGDTLKRDGWRFQPVPELPYKLQCRGQVTPASQRLVTELFIEERHDGPIPTVFADLLCTVDGLKAFHARRVGLQLVPDWPMASLDSPSNRHPERACAVVDGFRFDQRALLACADGRPSEAFGPMYRRFDGVQRVARLPSPPYHFISRIAEIDGPIGVMKAGARVVAEYDIPDAAWYFERNGSPVMPFAVLLEAALQPCGWLSSYVGSALTQEIELGFRNLDGDGEILGEIFPGDAILRTEVRLTDVSASGGMIIESFEVNCTLDARPIYRLKTVFGFFPEAALAAQAGLPVKDAHRDLLARAGGEAIDLGSIEPSQQAPMQPKTMLRMIDRIEAFWPQGGRAGLGAIRAVKDVDPGEWFFKAHFFQDPVQPGSLGLEAMVQTLAYAMRELGMAEGMAQPRFQALAVGQPHRWKYRGQVLPKHRTVHTTLEIIERGIDAQGAYALADASLWVDGQRIYECLGFGVRIVEAG